MYKTVTELWTARKQRTLFGRPLGISLIVFQKALWGGVLLVMAVLLLFLYTHHITNPLQRLFARELAEDPDDLVATTLIRLFPTISLKTELLLALGSIVYALLEAIEAWGLWRGFFWVEVLIVVETAALFPLDGWELVRAFSVAKVLTVIINILIFWYLLMRYLRRRKEISVASVRNTAQPAVTEQQQEKDTQIAPEQHRCHGNAESSDVHADDRRAGGKKAEEDQTGDAANAPL
jgi:uncharacterized membrane protein (DUF2068 family)